MLFVKEKLIKTFQEDMQEVLADKKNTNRTKIAQRDRYVIAMLETLPDGFVLDCEPTPKNPEKANAGSVIEIIANFWLNKNPDAMEGVKTTGVADAHRGTRAYEIKLNLNGSCYNTKLQRAMWTIVFTTEGIYKIPASVIMSLVNARGILPYGDLARFDGVSHYAVLEKVLFHR